MNRGERAGSPEHCPVHDTGSLRSAENKNYLFPFRDIDVDLPQSLFTGFPADLLPERVAYQRSFSVEVGQSFGKCDKYFVNESSHQPVQLSRNGILFVHENPRSAHAQFLQKRRSYHDRSRYIPSCSDNDVRAEAQQNKNGLDGSYEDIGQEFDHFGRIPDRIPGCMDEFDRDSFTGNHILFDSSPNADEKKTGFSSGEDRSDRQCRIDVPRGSSSG